MNSILAGSFSGFTATVPMTVFMQKMHEKLPAKEQYPLPPREIIEKISEDTGLDQALTEKDKFIATLVSHFGYGTAAGTVYASLFSKLPASGLMKGCAFGMFVWTGSYLKLLPALKILKPATEHPARRNALMIAAHLVWGGTLGVMVEKLANE
jgi:uncharacterized membrane protein YagU involved in acid resistance